MRKHLTIINDKNVRGVLAPANAMSQSALEGVIDFIELSDRKMMKETKMLIRQADKQQSWIPFSKKKARQKFVMSKGLAK